MIKYQPIAVALALMSSQASYAAKPADENAAEAKTIVKSYFTSLKGELQAAIKSGGPTKAIGVCKDRAPAIAEDLSRQTGWSVGRTSLKLRNAALNQPDEWERQVLMNFDKRKLAGEDPVKMAFSEVVKTGQGNQYRFMKAIPTAPLCLVCHGSNIAPDVQASLRQNYPNDMATGYEAGDIRGAFTLSKPLNTGEP